jgi:hypothetical protein
MTLYQEIRAAGTSMADKVMNAAEGILSEVARAARRMTIPVLGRGILVKNETTQIALLDFFWSEYRREGKTFAEMIDPVAAQLTPFEAECLEGIRRSRTSFFEAKGALPQTGQVSLRDLLQPERPEILLTDLGWSATQQRRQQASAAFCRVLTIRGITMTNGFLFHFRPELVPGLLQAHRQKLKRVPPENLSAERFIFFFKKYREIGSPQAYQDVS